MFCKKMHFIPAFTFGALFAPAITQATSLFPTSQMYVALNEQTQAIEQIYRLIEQRHFWTVDRAEDNEGKAWQTLQCGNKPCRFTKTSYKTKLRFFKDSEPLQKVIKNQITGMVLACVDSPKLAICRLDKMGKAPVFLRATKTGQLGVLTLMNRENLQAYVQPQSTAQPLEGLLKRSPFITVKNGKPHKILRFIPTQHSWQQQVFQQEQWRNAACNGKDSTACGFKPVAVKAVTCLANAQGETLCSLHVGEQRATFMWQKDPNATVERLYPADITYPVPLPSLKAKGVFVSLDKQKNIQRAFKFFPAKAGSNAEWHLQMLKNNQWETVNCETNKPCAFTATDSAKINALLAQNSNANTDHLRQILSQQQKGQTLHCAYTNGLAFCVLLEQKGVLIKRDFFLINRNGSLLPLQRSEESE